MSVFDSPLWKATAASRAAPRNDMAPGSMSLTQFSEWMSAGLSGTLVTEQTVMRLSAVYACVGLISGAIAGLPFHVYERDGDVRKRVDDPLWMLLNREMSPRWNAFAAWEYLTQSLLLHGDGFAVIRRPSSVSSAIRGFEPVHPNRVDVCLKPGGDELFYKLSPEVAGGKVETIDQADMIHVPGQGFDGLRGMSPLRFALSSAARVGLASQDYAGNFFENGARPDYVLQTDGAMKQDQVDMLRAQLSERHQGVGRAHLPMILQGGLKVEPVTMPLEDAQLLETRKFQIEEIARIYGVQPFMIGATETTSSWGSGVEQMGMGFVRYTLMRHLRRIETEINRKCFPTGSKRFAEFNPAALEAGDVKSQNEAFRMALGRAGEPGFMTVNEVRRLRNLPPVPGGDALNPGSTPLPDKKDDADAQS